MFTERSLDSVRVLSVVEVFCAPQVMLKTETPAEERGKNEVSNLVSPSFDDTSSKIEVPLHSADCFRANFLSQAVYYSCHKLLNFLSILRYIPK